MINMNVKSRILTLTMHLFLLSFLATSTDVVSSTTTIIYVYPDVYTAEYVGESFKIQVKVYDVVNLTAYQFKLKFNTTLLTCLNTCIGDVFPPPPRSTYIINIDNVQGIISVQAFLQAGENPAKGSGSLLSVIFNATKGTPYPQPRESCTLEIFDDYLYESSSQPIPHQTINGVYNSPYIPPELSLALNTDRENIYFDEKIVINGTLRGNSYLIPDGLIALEVDTPKGNPVVFRSLPTSPIPIVCPITIIELTPCDLDGTPKYNFQVGSIAYFKVSIKNNSPNDLNITVTINPYDSSNATLGTAFFTTFIRTGETLTIMLSVPIEKTSMSGNATVYANTFTGLPKNGGTPLSMEKSATFTISGSIQSTPTYMSPPPQGCYLTIINVHYKPHSSGNYTIYATTRYMGAYAMQRKQIKIVIAGDLNEDGCVTLVDLIILAKAYGSKPEDLTWNPNADLNRDRKISLVDLVILAKNYGKK